MPMARTVALELSTFAIDYYTYETQNYMQKEMKGKDMWRFLLMEKNIYNDSWEGFA